MSEKPIKPPDRRGPALGVLDGIKRDLQAAKDGDYDPRGVGSAWTHNFLNQKPWHPMNFRNRAKVWEAEQEHYDTEKRKAEAKAEFDREQEYLKTVSLLSEEEQRKYKERQSISWLYMKPPGYDDALARGEADQRKQGGEGADGSGAAPAAPPQQQQQQQQAGSGGAPKRGPGAGSGRSAVATMIGGLKAAQEMQDKFEMRRGLGGGGRSPPRGGIDPSRENQQFVVGEMDSEEEQEAMRLAFMPEEERRRLRKEAAKRAKQERKEATERAKQERKDAERQQLEQAKAFLRAAGLALPSDGEGSSDEGGSGSSSSSDSESDSGSSGGGEGEGGIERQRRQHKRRHKEARGEGEGGKRQKKERRDKGRRKEKAKKHKHKKRRHKE